MAKDTMATKIANPYAEALLDLAKSKNLIHDITSDIKNLRELLNSTPEFNNYLNNPVVRKEAKRDIITKTINSQINAEMSKFLMILIDRNRISYLDSISERYLELVYELANIKIVEVCSANELTEEQQQNLILKLQEMKRAKEIKLILTAKRDIITKTINSQINAEMSKFLMILIDRNRISYLDSISERYLELVYELANIKIVEVCSANELTEEQQQNLILKLQEMTRAKEIKLILTIDSNLLGGLLIKTNSQVIDLTIRGQLTELAKHLDSVIEI